MKKSVSKLLAGAFALTAIMMVSCGKELPGLTLDVNSPDEGGGKSDHFSR